MTAMLTIRDLAVSYGSVPAVREVSLEIMPGELRVILGANGAGKSTILKSVLGLLKPRSGQIEFAGGADLVSLKPHEIHALGIAWVPEGRQLWNTLTVLDNLKLGGFGGSDKQAVERRIGEMLERFPRLKERQHQVAGSLSGGEQQMVAIARALVAAPKLLLMDEPSLGLAPLIVREVFSVIRRLREEGMTILLVEQMANQALAIADRAYVIETGTITLEGTGAELLRDERVRSAYLGA